MEHQREPPIDLTHADAWLEPWLPLVRERLRDEPTLFDVGCGDGRDSALLAQAGARIVGIDRSAAAIDAARARVPSGEFHVQDVRAPFPLAAGQAGVVVASLSLHYFGSDETLSLVRRLCDALRPGGVMLCRLNSTNDHHHGASGHPAIETDYYLVNGEPKRFFDAAGVARLFAHGWRIVQREERCIDRYAHPKWVWEVVAEKTEASAR